MRSAVLFKPILIYPCVELDDALDLSSGVLWRRRWYWTCTNHEGGLDGRLDRLNPGAPCSDIQAVF
jgi:hypothetical protein